MAEKPEVEETLDAGVADIGFDAGEADAGQDFGLDGGVGADAGDGGFDGGADADEWDVPDGGAPDAADQFVEDAADSAEADFDVEEDCKCPPTESWEESTPDGKVEWVRGGDQHFGHVTPYVNDPHSPGEYIGDPGAIARADQIEGWNPSHDDPRCGCPPEEIEAEEPPAEEQAAEAPEEPPGLCEGVAPEANEAGYGSAPVLSQDTEHEAQATDPCAGECFYDVPDQAGACEEIQSLDGGDWDVGAGDEKLGHGESDGECHDSAMDEPMSDPEGACWGSD